MITSVFGQAQAEYTIKKSRFIATVREIKNETEAAAYVEAIRKQYWDARHNCYAWRLGEGGSKERSNDDGEPSGTAGRPILEVLKKRELTNTLIVVTRYFGGIKLGASGLIRAYSHTAALGLENAQIAAYTPFDVVAVTVAYSFVNLLEKLAQETDVRIEKRDFAADVTFTLAIPQTETKKVLSALTDSTNGQARFKKQEPVVIPVIRGE